MGIAQGWTVFSFDGHEAVTKSDTARGGAHADKERADEAGLYQLILKDEAKLWVCDNLQ
jgi:hypothetical protein